MICTRFNISWILDKRIYCRSTCYRKCFNTPLPVVTASLSLGLPPGPTRTARATYAATGGEAAAGVVTAATGNARRGEHDWIHCKAGISVASIPSAPRPGPQRAHLRQICRRFQVGPFTLPHSGNLRGDDHSPSRPGRHASLPHNQRSDLPPIPSPASRSWRLTPPAI
jgi:hypothetical protein